jgi:hypothetical protein
VSRPVGADFDTFPIRTSGVAAPVSALVSAVYHDRVVTGSFSVLPHYTVTLTIQPDLVIGGLLAEGTLTLNAPAPAAGLTVRLTGERGVVSFPQTTGVGAGSTIGHFLIPTRPSTDRVTVNLTAALGAIRSSASLTVVPSPLSAIVLDRTSVLGGGTVHGVVMLSSPAPPGGAVVQLRCDHPDVALPPARVRVASGVKEAPFQVVTTSVSAAAPVQIRAALGGVALTTVLTVLPTMGGGP